MQLPNVAFSTSQKRRRKTPPRRSIWHCDTGVCLAPRRKTWPKRDQKSHRPDAARHPRSAKPIRYRRFLRFQNRPKISFRNRFPVCQWLGMSTQNASRRAARWWSARREAGVRREARGAGSYAAHRAARDAAGVSLFLVRAAPAPSPVAPRVGGQPVAKRGSILH